MIINYMLNNILKSEYNKHLLILISTTGLSQLIPFFTLPLLQKYYYSPSDFGVLSIYTGVSMLFFKLSTFSYELAIVSQKRKSDAYILTIAAIEILSIMSIISLVVISFSYFFWKDNFYVIQLKWTLFYIPVTVFAFGLHQILRNWLNREKLYKTIGVSLIVKSAASETTKFIVFYTFLSNFGLIIGRVFGEIFGAFYLLWKNVAFNQINYKKVSRFKKNELLKKNYKYPLYSMPSSFKGVAMDLIFISLFANFFGVANAGILGISVSYITVAYGIISQSFSQVFYKRITELYAKELFIVLKKNVIFLSSLSFMIFILILIIPNNIVSDILGEQWGNLMTVTKILMIPISISFVSSSVSFIYIRLNRQKEMLLFDLMHLIVVTASILLGYTLTNNFIYTLIYYVIAQSISYSIALYLSFYFVKKTFIK